MTRNPTLRRLAAAAVLLLTMALGACGSDDDAADSSTPADEAAPSAAGGDAVKIVDFNYKPADLKVKAGTTVTFTNEDSFAHTVTAKDKSFDSGNMDKDATFEMEFATAGTFEYLCAIHNSMTGKVTVS